MSCEVCRNLSFKVKECEECRPELMRENFDSANVFTKCKGQVLMTGMGDVIGLNHLAVKMHMELLDIPIQHQGIVLDKVCLLFYHYQEELEQYKPKGD